MRPRRSTSLLAATVTTILAATAVAATPAHLDDFVPTYRWVGFFPVQLADPFDEPCPSPAQAAEWSFGRLFSPSVAASALGIPVSDPTFREVIAGGGTPDLQTGVWCVYEANARPSSHAEAGVRARDLPEYATGGPDPDPAMVVPYTDPSLVSNIVSDLHEHALAQLGGVSSVPPASEEHVRVAVLDSALPSPVPGLPGYGQFAHGRDMALLIRQLACPDNTAVGAGCAVGVYNYLALDQVPDGAGGAFTDRTRGGYFGTIGRLAETTWMAWLEWRLFNPEADLILNYSVGWEAVAGLADPNAAEDAVMASITRARCDGALAVAAAGNDHGGPKPSVGPAYPAGFEPLELDCGSPPSNEPLVYSVGGIDGFDEPIANSRSAGRPRLAAYAFSVGADERYVQPGEVVSWHSTPPLTGSSLAAAAVSGIAAAAWPIAGGSAADLVATIYDNGTELYDNTLLPLQADYHGVNGAPDIRRVSLCRTLAALVPDRYACATPIAANPSWSHTDKAAFAKSARSVTLNLGRPQRLFACGDATGYPSSTPVRKFVFSSPIAPVGCPDQQHYNDTVGPQVRSQPGSPVCTVCTVHLNSNGGDAYVLLNPSLEADVNVLQLKITGPGTLIYVDLDQNIAPSAPVVYSGLPSTLNQIPDATAELVATLNNGTSVVLTQPTPTSQ